MVIVTTRDQLMNPRWQWDLVDHLADPVVVEVSARHEAPLTHPEELAAALVAFAADREPPVTTSPKNRGGGHAQVSA